MQSVKKFKSFEDLKSEERKMTDYSLSLKKHKAFEEFVKSIKTNWTINSQSK